MKKGFLLIIAFLAAIPAFAQEDSEEPADWKGNRRMTITSDIAPLVVGTILGGFGLNLGFEYAITRPVSLKANAYFIGFDPENLFYSSGGSSFVSMGRFSAAGRWYPAKKYADGWFVGGGMQYHYLYGQVGFEDYYYDDYGEEPASKFIFNTVGLSLGGGYKAVLGKGRAAFVLEPSLSYDIILYSDIPFKQMSAIEAYYVGWILGVKGFRFDLLLGAAF